MEAQAKERAGTTFDVIDKLKEGRGAVVSKLATIPDPVLVAKCEAMLIGFDELIAGVRRLAPDVEQMKGLAKGLQLAAPMVLQHVKVLQEKYPDPGQGDLLKFGRDVVVSCHKSVEEAWRKQREEMVRTMGRFDGGVNSALTVLRRIEQIVTSYEQALETERDLEEDPFAEVRTAPDQQAGDNGTKQTKKAAKKAPRKRAAKRTKKATEDQPN